MYYVSKIVVVGFLLLLRITVASSADNEAPATEEDIWDSSSSKKKEKQLWFNNFVGFNSQPELYANIRDPAFRSRFRKSNNAASANKAGGTRGGDGTASAEYKKHDDISKAVKKIVKESMDMFELTGVSVGVIEKDEVVFSDGFGYADKEKGIRATDKTHYHIASMSKAFTSMLLAIYADDPLIKLNLDVPVRNHGVFYDNRVNETSPLFPEWKMDDDEATLGTALRDMLNHRTGLPRHDILGFALASSKDDLLNKLAGLESDHPFRTSPGEYNNIMFALAGLAAERLEASKKSKSATPDGDDNVQDKASPSSSSSWDDLVKSKVFDLLNMTETFPSRDAFGDRKTLARGYLQGLPLPEDSNNLHHVCSPAGGVISNVNDMLKWAQLHLRQFSRLTSGGGGDDDGPYLLSDEIYSMNFVQPQTVFPLYTEMDTYSNGWWHIPLHGTGNILVTHGGNLFGFSLAIGLLPNPVEEVGNSAVIVLTNEDGSTGRDSLLLKLAELLQERAGYTALAASKMDWDQLFLEVMKVSATRNAEMDKAIEEKIANTPAAGKTPLLDLVAYVGSYVDVKGSYGRMDITMKHEKSKNKNGLYLSVKDIPWKDEGDFFYALGHMYFDTFRLCDPVDTVACTNEVQWTFETNGYDRVTGLKVYGLEPEVVITLEKVLSSSSPPPPPLLDRTAAFAAVTPSALDN